MLERGQNMTQQGGFVDVRADAVRVIEAIHGSSPSDVDWARDVGESAAMLFPSACHIVVHAVTYGPQYELVGIPFSWPVAADALLASFVSVATVSSTAWKPFYFGRAVSTLLEVAKTLVVDNGRMIDRAKQSNGYHDAIGIVAHPRPGLATVISAVYEEPVRLERRERALLTRIAMHLEAGHRLRTDRGALIGEIDARGRFEVSDGQMPARLAPHVARISRARSQRTRTSPEASELWTALVEGRASVVPRGDGYLVLDNPPSSHKSRALSPRECSILSLAARGLSAKEICYALGISPALVSMGLAGAAGKIGVLTRTELIRVAALLARDTVGLLDDDALTAAERDVLGLIERGMGNREIATIRMRSVRTIANQVAALLRKTGTSSRRELVARSARAKS